MQQKHKEMWGYAVSQHQMELVAKWQLENATIISKLFGFNGRIYFDVNVYGFKENLHINEF